MTLVTVSTNLNEYVFIFKSEKINSNTFSLNSLLIKLRTPTNYLKKSMKRMQSIKNLFQATRALVLLATFSLLLTASCKKGQRTHIKDGLSQTERAVLGNWSASDFAEDFSGTKTWAQVSSNSYKAVNCDVSGNFCKQRSMTFQSNKTGLENKKQIEKDGGDEIASTTNFTWSIDQNNILSLTNIADKTKIEQYKVIFNQGNSAQVVSLLPNQEGLYLYISYTRR